MLSSDQYSAMTLAFRNDLHPARTIRTAYIQDDILFEWDGRQNRENKRSHRASFEEAQSGFLDENAIRFFDPDHSQDEDRFLMLGMSFTLRVLVVCHCYREDDSVIRIISRRSRRLYPRSSTEYRASRCGTR